MRGQEYSPEFNDEALRQAVDRGYAVPEGAEGLVVSAHSFDKWMSTVQPDKSKGNPTLTAILALHASIRNELLDVQVDV